MCVVLQTTTIRLKSFRGILQSFFAYVFVLILKVTFPSVFVTFISVDSFLLQGFANFFNKGPDS